MLSLPRCHHQWSVEMGNEAIEQSNEAQVAACDAVDKKSSQKSASPLSPLGLSFMLNLPHFHCDHPSVHRTPPFQCRRSFVGCKSDRERDWGRVGPVPNAHPILPHGTVTDTRHRLPSPRPPIVWIPPIRPTDPHHQLRRAVRHRRRRKED